MTSPCNRRLVNKLRRSDFAHVLRPADGALEQLTTGGEVQLELDVGAVCFDRLDADGQLFGDLG